MYILAKISSYHLQLKCMGSHFLSGSSYIESTALIMKGVTDKCFKTDGKNYRYYELH